MIQNTSYLRYLPEHAHDPTQRVVSDHQALRRPPEEMAQDKHVQFRLDTLPGKTAVPNVILAVQETVEGV